MDARVFLGLWYILWESMTKLEVRPKGHRQHPSFQEWQYWLDWGLPEDTRGSVSDKAEEVKEPGHLV